MIALDTNILIDLLVSTQEFHAASQARLVDLQRPLATTSVNVAECLRLLTHSRVFFRPLCLAPAVDLLEQFFGAYDVLVLREAATWWLDLRRIAEDLPDLRGNEVFDARIALCLRHNGVRTLWTRDNDFRKYPFLELLS